MATTTSFKRHKSKLHVEPRELKSDIEADKAQFLATQKSLTAYKKTLEADRRARANFGIEPEKFFNANDPERNKFTQKIMQQWFANLKLSSARIDDVVKRMDRSADIFSNLPQQYAPKLLRQYTQYVAKRKTYENTLNQFNDAKEEKKGALSSKLDSAKATYVSDEDLLLQQLRDSYEKPRLDELHVALGHLVANEIEVETTLLNNHSRFFDSLCEGGGLLEEAVEDAARVNTEGFFEVVVAKKKGKGE